MLVPWKYVQVVVATGLWTRLFTVDVADSLFHKTDGHNMFFHISVYNSFTQLIEYFCHSITWYAYPTHLKIVN